jgi:hypothetical protein
MEIKTEYNINDELWFIHPRSGKPASGKVVTITVEVVGRQITKAGQKRDLIKTGDYAPKSRFTRYYLDDRGSKNETVCKSQYDLFVSKEKLIESLIKS